MRSIVAHKRRAALKRKVECRAAQLAKKQAAASNRRKAKEEEEEEIAADELPPSY